MKTVVKQLLHGSVLVCLFSMMILVTGCKKDSDPKPTEMDLFIEQLSTNWLVSEVSVDEIEVTDAFEDLTLSFTKQKTYTVTNPVVPIWPASGTFTVNGNTANIFTIQRNDGMAVKVISISATRLQLEFNYSAPTSRTEQVSGKYEFTFSKK